jgi:sugar/nucleoside kinase (ribokinase family)
MPVRPDYLVIGHICRDLYNGGYKLGGTATFSALTAHSLGCRAGIVSSNGPDVDLSILPEAILIAVRPCTASTTFQNLYLNGHRRQHIGFHADVLGAKDVPADWQSSPIVHLGPVDQEVDDQIIECFPDSLIGLTPQGWMRSWDTDGIVHPAVWQPRDALLERANAVILSREDVGGDVALVRRYASKTRTLVLTAGWKGATVYSGGHERSFPAPTVREIDPTGAGDIFATAFLIALHNTQDPYLSGEFANCIAAHSVERTGMDSIPTATETARCQAHFGGLIWEQQG